MVVDASIAPARGVSRVDVVRIGLFAAVVLLLAVTAAFGGHRLAAPVDGTQIGIPAAQAGSVGVAVEADQPGSAPIAAGDRIVAILGREVDAWANLLLDPGVVRPAVDVEDPIALVVARDGRQVPLTIAAVQFDPLTAVLEAWACSSWPSRSPPAASTSSPSRPDDPAARAMLVGGVALLASVVGGMLGLQALDLVTATGFWLYAATAGLAYAIFLGGVLRFALVFPRPHPFVGNGRPAVVAWLLPLVALAAVAVAAGLTSGRMLAAADAWRGGVTVVQIAVAGAASLLLASSYRRVVDPVNRLKLGWLAGAVALAAVAAVALWFGPLLLLGEPLLPRNALPLVLLPIPVALAITISRRHLFDLDAVINRSVVYGGLTAGVIVTYAFAVALLGRFIPGNAPFAVALLSAGAVAVVALPLHDRLQQGRESADVRRQG